MLATAPEPILLQDSSKSHTSVIKPQASAKNPQTGSISGFPALRSLVESSGGCAVIDGGLATELEARGANLNDPLWSAKYLLDEVSQDLIRQVHYDYYKAGADICASASYQATIQGFIAKGFTEEEAEQLLVKSVELVVVARNQFWADYQLSIANGSEQPDQGHHHDCNGKGKTQLHQSAESGLSRRRHKPLVAASVGSYGAYLADGSEYSGNYGPTVSLEYLKDFHRRRLVVLAAAGADIIALETVPCRLEAQAYAELLEELQLPIPAWMTFNSKDGVNVVSGDPIEDCALVAHNCEYIVGTGINCTPPRWITGLVKAMRKVTNKPIVVYPNSGETYDAEKKQWVPTTGVSDDDFAAYSPEWKAVGANLIGGCCRTCPKTVASIRAALER